MLVVKMNIEKKSPFMLGVKLDIETIKGHANLH